MPNYLDDGDMVYIGKSDDAELARSRLKANDVLLTITGVSYWKSAVVPSEYAGSNINQHSVRMTLRPGKLKPVFVSAFLNSRQGKMLSDQNITGGTRPALDYEAIKQFRIPLASDRLQHAIESTVHIAQERLKSAKALVQTAEIRLLAFIGLATWTPPQPLTYIRRASDVLAAGRFDADYFSPEKLYAIERLGRAKSRRLGEVVASMRDMYNPAEAATAEMVRNFDVTDALQPELTDETLPTPGVQLGSIKKRMQPGDVAISRLRSYLREIAVVRTTTSVPTVGSSEFIVLRPKVGHSLSAGALLVFLRSEPVQAILRWCRDGSQHPRFAEDDLLAIPVPERVWEVSDQLDNLVNASFESRRRARELLERAKRAVEIAIEESEDRALRYLDQAPP